MDAVMQAEVQRAVNLYAQMLFKICLVILCNEQDAQDAVQDTFFKYMQKSPVFHDPEHEKAWLLSVATNICKNMKRYRLMHMHQNLEDVYGCLEDKEETPLLEALVTLPHKYKEALLLYYVEGYKVKEISAIIGASPAAIKKRLQKGRELLKDKWIKEELWDGLS